MGKSKMETLHVWAARWQYDNLLLAGCLNPQLADICCRLLQQELNNPGP
jgi:hypothetical protein